MAGEATGAQIGAFLAALRAKGETRRGDRRPRDGDAGEGAAGPDHDGPSSTPAGPAATRPGTFNISTAAAIVAAGAGLTVAKHGNRAITSRCGSADVLEALGVKINLGPTEVGECLDRVGVGFMFAPLYHPAMKHANGVAQGARHPNRLQPPRPADEPGRRGGAGARRADGRSGREDGPGAPDARGAALPRRPRRRRRRRAIHLRAEPGRRGARRRNRHLHHRARGRRPRPARAATSSRGGTARGERGCASAGSSRARTAAPAESSC